MNDHVSNAVYLCQTKEHIGTNILKLGLTGNIDWQRFNGYGGKSGCTVLQYIELPNNLSRHNVEYKLKQVFNDKFKLAHGKEYFEGNIEKMIITFINTVCECVNNHKTSEESAKKAMKSEDPAKREKKCHVDIDGTYNHIIELIYKYKDEQDNIRRWERECELYYLALDQDEDPEFPKSLAKTGLDYGYLSFYMMYKNDMCASLDSISERFMLQSKNDQQVELHLWLRYIWLKLKYSKEPKDIKIVDYHKRSGFVEHKVLFDMELSDDEEEIEKYINIYNEEEKYEIVK